MSFSKMKFFWLFALPILLYLIYFVFVLVYGTISDYKPDEIVDIEILNNKDQIASDSTQFTFMIWNLGYAGLGAESDFFLDGGSMVKPSKQKSSDYLEGIKQFVATQSNIDFLLLQEVDVKAKRSYKVNEFEEVAQVLPSHSKAHAFNFNVKFVPKPLTSFSPIGQVQSGIATYSRYQVSKGTRFQYPGSYSWPTSAFHLDRCMLETRIPLASGKELIVINSHNSAYDGGLLKPQEMAYLKNHLLVEYEKGNYVVVGADWNQCPPNFAYDTFAKELADDYHQDNIAPDFMPAGWQWAYDDTTPTNRKLSKAYKENETFTTLIDFYLLSPNVSLIEVEGVQLNFAYSDHQPVKLKIQLK